MNLEHRHCDLLSKCSMMYVGCMGVGSKDKVHKLLLEFVQLFEFHTKTLKRVLG